MPKIELTSEQAEELWDVLQLEFDDTVREMKACPSGDPDYIEWEHKRSVLSDILHLLEIA
jgi:hypothetical protein